MKELSLDDVIQMFEEARAAGKVHLFEKHGDVLARPATVGEVVDTVIDGIKETTNTAKEGQLVVTGPKGEDYLIGADKFAARYKPTGGTPEGHTRQRYSPIGTIHAYTYEGEPIKFMAPWGELMIAETGDAIGTTEIGSRDIYRIERNVFAQTYKRSESAAA